MPVHDSRSALLKERVLGLNAAIERQDFEAIAGMLAPTLIHGRRGLERTLPLLLRGRPRAATPVDGFRLATAAIAEHFSAWHADVDALYCDGDTVVARQTMRGQLRGRFPGSDRDDPSFSFPMVVTFRFDGDRIAEIWALGDELGFWEQLGIGLRREEIE